MNANLLTDLLGNSSDKKEMVYKDSQLEIVKNIMTYEGSFLQLSNITQVWKGKIEKESLPVVPLLIGGIVGIVLLFFSSISAFFAFLGVIVLGIVVFVVYRHSQIPQYYGLNIELNSGRTVAFSSTDVAFIAKAFEVLGNIVADRTEYGDAIINFGNGTIVSKSSSVSMEGADNERRYNNQL